MAVQTYNRSGLLDAVAGGGLAVFAAALVAEHLLTPGLGVRRHQISEYANAAHGWVLTAGFAGWCVALLATALLVRRRRPLGACFAVAGVAVAALALFPTQTVAGRLPDGVARSVGGQVHDRAVLVLSGALVLAAVLVAADRQRPRGLRPAVAAALLAGVGGALVLLAAGDPAPGVRQRVLVAAALVLHALVLAAPRMAGRTAPGG